MSSSIIVLDSSDEDETKNKKSTSSKNIGPANKKKKSNNTLPSTSISLPVKEQGVPPGSSLLKKHLTNVTQITSPKMVNHNMPQTYAQSRNQKPIQSISVTEKSENVAINSIPNLKRKSPTVAVYPTKKADMKNPPGKASPNSMQKSAALINNNIKIQLPKRPVTSNEATKTDTSEMNTLAGGKNDGIVATKKRIIPTTIMKSVDEAWLNRDRMFPIDDGEVVVPHVFYGSMEMKTIKPIKSSATTPPTTIKTAIKSSSTESSFADKMKSTVNSSSMSERLFKSGITVNAVTGVKNDMNTGTGIKRVMPTTILRSVDDAWLNRDRMNVSENSEILVSHAAMEMKKPKQTKTNLTPQIEQQILHDSAEVSSEKIMSDRLSKSGITVKRLPQMSPASITRPPLSANSVMASNHSPSSVTLTYARCPVTLPSSVPSTRPLLSSITGSPTVKSTMTINPTKPVAASMASNSPATCVALSLNSRTATKSGPSNSITQYNNALTSVASCTPAKGPIPSSVSYSSTRSPIITVTSKSAIPSVAACPPTKSALAPVVSSIPPKASITSLGTLLPAKSPITSGTSYAAAKSPVIALPPTKSPIISGASYTAGRSPVVSLPPTKSPIISGVSYTAARSPVVSLPPTKSPIISGASYTAARFPVVSLPPTKSPLTSAASYGAARSPVAQSPPAKSPIISAASYPVTRSPIIPAASCPPSRSPIASMASYSPSRSPVASICSTTTSAVQWPPPNSPISSGTSYSAPRFPMASTISCQPSTSSIASLVSYRPIKSHVTSTITCPTSRAPVTSIAACPPVSSPVTLMTTNSVTSIITCTSLSSPVISVTSTPSLNPIVTTASFVNSSTSAQSVISPTAHNLTSNVEATKTVTTHNNANDEVIQIDPNDNASTNENPKVEQAEEKTMNDEKQEQNEPLQPDFEELLKTCRTADPSSDMEKLIKNKLIKYYYIVHPDFVKSRGFLKTVRNTIELIKADPDLVYYNLKSVVEELKARRKSKAIVMNNEETATTTGNKKLDEQIKKLNKALLILTRRIQALDEEDVDLDDEDSSYLQVERYKKRACEIYEKICDLTGESKNAHRLVKKPVHFQGTSYPQFNKTLQAYVNRTKEFPDYLDVLRMLEFCNKQYSFDLRPEEVEMIAQDAFISMGKLLQSRRKADLYETVSHFTSNLKDPAITDPVLLSKLTENQKQKKKISSVIERYARAQDLGTLEEDDDDDKKKEGKDLEENQQKDGKNDDDADDDSDEDNVQDDDDDDDDDDHDDDDDDDDEDTDNDRTPNGDISDDADCESISSANTIENNEINRDKTKEQNLNKAISPLSSSEIQKSSSAAKLPEKSTICTNQNDNADDDDDDKPSTSRKILNGLARRIERTNSPSSVISEKPSTSSAKSKTKTYERNESQKQNQTPKQLLSPSINVSDESNASTISFTLSPKSKSPAAAAAAPAPAAETIVLRNSPIISTKASLSHISNVTTETPIVIDDSPDKRMPTTSVSGTEPPLPFQSISSNVLKIISVTSLNDTSSNCNFRNSTAQPSTTSTPSLSVSSSSVTTMRSDPSNHRTLAEIVISDEES